MDWQEVKGWGAASGLGSPRGTKQPLSHLCPAPGLLSTITQQLPAPEHIRKATGEENARGPGRRLVDGWVGGMWFVAPVGEAAAARAGPGCSWALIAGSRAWLAAQHLLSAFHCSGAPRGWASAAAMSPGSHPQKGGQEEERSPKIRSMPQDRLYGLHASAGSFWEHCGGKKTPRTSTHHITLPTTSPYPHQLFRDK